MALLRVCEFLSGPLITDRMERGWTRPGEKEKHLSPEAVRDD